MNQTNTSKRIPTQINEFRGDYAFLSNFYPAPISYMGQTYANNEAAFQAQKTLSAREQRKFCIFRMHNPSDAKKLGRDLTLRPDWEKVKVLHVQIHAEPGTPGQTSCNRRVHTC